MSQPPPDLAIARSTSPGFAGGGRLYTLPSRASCASGHGMLKARGASVAGFALFIVGEGIEKKVNDFAAEVAAQAAAAAGNK